MKLSSLDPESLMFFSQKGLEIGGPHTGDANAVKVRRVIQLLSDYLPQNKENVRVLDVACGDGVYSIEAALHGFRTVGFDARSTRLRGGAECAERNNIGNVEFIIKDLRSIDEIDGQFDAILLLGIIYHLTAEDVAELLTRCAKKSELIIIDTHYSSTPTAKYSRQDVIYDGTYYKEHDAEDDEQVMYSRVGASLGNVVSFQYTKKSLVRLLTEIGFTSVLECLSPMEPGKPDDRITLLARKGKFVEVVTYPWINGKSEAEIAECIGQAAGAYREDIRE